MKQNKYLLIPFLISSLLSSCTKEDSIDEPICLNPNVAGISLTRAGIENVSAVSAIGIYAVNKDNTQTTYGISPAGTYGKYTYSASGFTAAAGEAIWLCSETAIIFSCHPAPANGSVITNYTPVTPPPADPSVQPNPTIPIPADLIVYAPASSTTVATDPNNSNSLDFADPAKDYMYGVKYDAGKPEAERFTTDQPDASNGRKETTITPNVNIGLKHVLTQIKLVIKKSDDYYGTANVTNVKYERVLYTLGNDTRMQLKDGKLLNLPASASKAYTYNLDAGKKASDNDVILINYALPLDESISKNSTFILMVDGKEMKYEYDNDPLWKPGKIYTYTLTIAPMGVKLQGFTVVGWGTEDSTGDVEI